MLKRILFSIGIAFTLCFEASAYTVLIDPGHGGEDLGAVGYIHEKKKKIPVYEKDLVLQISKKLQEELRKKRYKTFLSRSFDHYITLQQRADIADQVQADIFISIHLNAAYTKKARGFETYYLDNHTDAAVKKVEEVENKSLEGDALVIQQILIDLVVERTAKTSKKLANAVHEAISDGVGKSYKQRDRDSKPGMFYVLALSKRPAVLIESGFMSNEVELRQIMTDKYQYQLARDIAKGVDQFMLTRQKNEVPLF